MLAITPLSDVMYGYSTSRDESGAMTFETWVWAKKTGRRSEQEINTALLWGERQLMNRTIGLALLNRQNDVSRSTQ
jgi:hypothetical protein